MHMNSGKGDVIERKILTEKGGKIAISSNEKFQSSEERNIRNFA